MDYPTIEILKSFLVAAKRNTYASGIAPSGESRPGSFDLPYQEGEFRYLDSYLGGIDFIGEEAVWWKGTAVWGMNYYGWMLAESVPDAFGHFLKTALSRIPEEAPFRGPEMYEEGDFRYTCRWTGDVMRFVGEEMIELKGQPVYRLLFHGGRVMR